MHMFSQLNQPQGGQEDIQKSRTDLQEPNKASQFVRLPFFKLLVLWISSIAFARNSWRPDTTFSNYNPLVSPSGDDTEFFRSESSKADKFYSALCLWQLGARLSKCLWLLFL
jgi:hypothetical protein